jgi:hyperosmotically inducible periplasmic protein
MKGKSLSNVALACQLFVATAGLSLAAPNVKIISRDGMVTLKGTVKSDEEKKAIGDKATEVAGQGKVTSELTVTPSGSK